MKGSGGLLFPAFLPSSSENLGRLPLNEACRKAGKESNSCGNEGLFKLRHQRAIRGEGLDDEDSFLADELHLLMPAEELVAFLGCGL